MRTAKRSLAIAGAVLAVFLAAAGTVIAADEAATSASPSLSIPIPTINLSDIVRGEGYVDIPWLADYLTGAYKYLLGIGAFIAAVMMIIAGAQWLTAGGDAGKVTKARSRITNSILGLVLLFGTYLLLVTVNPDLVSMKPLRVQTVARQFFTDEDMYDQADISLSASGGGDKPQAVCDTVEKCKVACASKPWPKSTSGMLDPGQALPIPSIAGLDGGIIKASQQVIDGLTKAAAIAAAKGLTIKVVSGYRTLETQMSIVCNQINSGNTSKLGKATAWPGSSGHGAGYAVDVNLLSGSTVLVGSGSCTKQAAGTLATPENSKLLDDIMTQAGARRYQREVWHYEFGSSTGCRCTYPNCPSPPMDCAGACI